MSIKILIAEDEEITAKHLMYALKREGYNVTSVNNGTDAYKKIRQEEFNLLITDIKMPGMDGFTLLDRVKDNYPDIEVIITTGFGNIKSAVDAMRKGAADFITKPFKLDEIIVKIKKIQEKKVLKKKT